MDAESVRLCPLVPGWLHDIMQGRLTAADAFDQAAAAEWQSILSSNRDDVGPQSCAECQYRIF